MAETTDTERLSWLEEMGGELAVLRDDTLASVAYRAYTPFTSWVDGENLRDAIDKARARLEEGVE